LEKTDLNKLIKTWADFFVSESCGKCVPCREGSVRMNEILQQKIINLKVLRDIFFSLEQTSFCSFGRLAPKIFISLMENVVKNGIKEEN
jgi:NADH:ubiquinone oxidoreductase subunit F (NADH-binding)